MDKSKLLDWANKAIEYGVANIPDVIRQYLAWCFWSDLALVIVWTALGFVAIRLGIKSFRKYKEDDYDSEYLAGALTAYVLCVVFYSCALGSLYFALKAKLAPAAYIIDLLMP